MIQVDDAKCAAQRAARGEVGVLRIGFIAGATAPILPRVVGTYRRRYPEVELQLQHMDPDAQFAAFDEAGIDVGFSRPLPPERQRGFEEEMIYSDYLDAVLPPKHRWPKKRKLNWRNLPPNLSYSSTGLARPASLTKPWRRVIEPAFRPTFGMNQI